MSLTLSQFYTQFPVLPFPPSSSDVPEYKFCIITDKIFSDSCGQFLNPLQFSFFVNFFVFYSSVKVQNIISFSLSCLSTDVLYSFCISSLIFSCLSNIKIHLSYHKETCITFQNPTSRIKKYIIQFIPPTNSSQVSDNSSAFIIFSRKLMLKKKVIG